MYDKLVVVIPARYGSSRFEGKPLVKIAGKTMLNRVYEIALKAIDHLPHAEVIICTEDERIIEHASELGAKAVLTSQDCLTGSDRVLNACAQLDYTPNIVINLQGDTPLTPPRFVNAIIQALINDESIDVATPVTQLSWQQLDDLRQRKQKTPFSGTTAIIDKKGVALWFSKQIIPAIRDEPLLRKQSSLSPIFRHIGLYGYRFDALKRFIRLKTGYYETLEGLEQLRMLEYDMKVKTVTVDYGKAPSMSGVDTEEDAKLAESLLLTYGEILND